MGNHSAIINYVSRTHGRARYYANAHEKDEVVIAPERMVMTDGRATHPALAVEGFQIVPHISAVADFSDGQAVWDIHRPEIADLVKAVTGADAVCVNAPGLLRFSEKSGKAGSLNNSMPARFAHVDINDETAAQFAVRSAPEGRAFSRCVSYNIWRALSAPPQDVPLAFCDARSVARADLMDADAVFDEPGKPEWSFVSHVVGHNPAHRWHWYSNMTRDEAVIFVTNDSDAARPHAVPHVAFDDERCPADAEPRISIEMRAMAYWF